MILNAIFSSSLLDPQGMAHDPVCPGVNSYHLCDPQGQQSRRKTTVGIAALPKNSIAWAFGCQSKEVIQVTSLY